MLHELGHLLGLDHCIYYDCIMNGVSGIYELFNTSYELCPVCLCKIYRLLDFDIIKRFENLQVDYQG